MPLRTPSLCQTWSRPSLLTSRHASTLSSGTTVKEDWNLGGSETLEAPQDTTTESALPLSRVLRQVRDYQLRHPKHLLLTRVGEFYELYYEQADEIGALLNLTIVDRRFRNQPVRFGGFPIRQLSRHLRTLVRVHGRTVALNEQFQDPITKEFDRRVTRLITPGTLITEEEDGTMAGEPRDHDFLLTIYPSPSRDATFGLAWVDLSTGDFFTKVASDSSQTIADLTRLSPREIVLPLGESSVILDRASLTLGTILERWMGKEVGRHLLRRQNAALSQFEDDSREVDLFTQYLSSMSHHHTWQESSGRANPADFTPLESQAGSFLLGYMRKVLVDQVPTLSYPQRDQIQDTMRLDHATIQGLELIRSLRDNTKTGSILHTMDRTVTAVGSRLLARQLCMY